MSDDEDKVSQAAKDIAKNTGNKVKDKGVNATKSLTKNTLKNIFNFIAKIVFSKIAFLILLAVILAVVVVILIAGFVKLCKEDDADKTTGYGKYSINTVLGLTDISELVTINGTPQGGYSLAFVDDIDEQLQRVINSNEQYRAMGITNVEVLKKYIEAELVTQLPDLGNGIDASKLPNLEGVDLLYEPEESTNVVTSMEDFLLLGDSFVTGVESTEMLSECQYKASLGVDAKYWLDHFDELPNEASGVSLLFGVNNLPNSGLNKDNMQKLVTKLAEKYEGKPIYIQKVFPLGKKYNGKTTQEWIDNYNKEMEEFCKDKDNIYFIDTTSGYIDEVGYLISNDGVHPTDYKTLVSNIKNKILINGGSSSGGTLSGDTIEEQVWSFFINEGLTEEATAAIMGNMEAESAMIPNRVQGSSVDDPENGSGPAAGIVQWENYNTKSSRWAEMNAYCESKGKDWRDLQCQLEYIILECEEKNEFAHASYWPSEYNIDYNQFKTSNDLEFATNCWAACFERCYPENAHMDNRIAAAKSYYEQFSGTTPAPRGSIKKAMAVTNRQVSPENEFQAAIKLKRAIPDKGVGDLSEANGKVIEMNYVPQGVFNAYLNQQNSNVLEVFTISNSREVIFAKWSYEEGEMKYTKASAVNMATVMEKYTMPYDYLMMFNIYGEDVKFCMDLADLAIDSEYIVAIQDNAVTTETSTEQTVVYTYEEAVIDEDEHPTGETIQRRVEEHYGPYVKLTETDTQKVELTYADSWAVKVHNEVTYRDETTAERDDSPLTTNDPVSTTEEDTSTPTTIETTTTETTTNVTNKYSSGKTIVEKEKAGDKFVAIYETSTELKQMYPEWFFEALNSNASTAKLLDLTKYLLYKATKVNYGVLDPEEVFAQYEDNEFKDVDDEKKRGTVGWAFIRAWENNELRKFMENDGTYTYDSSANIYSCVTEDRKKYILHDEIGQGKQNKVYGCEVMIYDTSGGRGWQNVDLFKEKGINIRESEYNVYGESQIDVETVDDISITSWEKMAEKVETRAEVKGIDLETTQRDCLVDILYDRGDVYKVLECFKKYGLDEDKFKQLDEFKGARGNARWILFSEGRYPTPIEGEDLDPANYWGGGGDIIEAAAECWKWVCKNDPVYGPTSIPPSGSIDCSGFVTWVLYTMGYTEFSHQWNTQTFIEQQEHLKKDYGWEIIPIAAGEDISSKVQPGDIIDRSVGTGSDGHVNIVVSFDDGVLMTYDCGRRTHWSGNTNANPFNATYFLTDSKPGIIIRGVKAQ